MSIEFFDLKCRSKSDKSNFGLCDDPPPSNSPAYINEDDLPAWIGEVANINNEDVSFFAIDNCVTILRSDGTSDSRCDGVLSYSNKLIFVELKSRRTKKWFKKGREQITATIVAFKKNHDISIYKSVEAYVCNNLRPIAHVGQAENIQKFKDKTGYILRGKRDIDLT